jgi:hypothetical protein
VPGSERDGGADRGGSKQNTPKSESGLPSRISLAIFLIAGGIQTFPAGCE